jgi:hypothetical protein
LNSSRCGKGKPRSNPSEFKKHSHLSGGAYLEAFVGAESVKNRIFESAAVQGFSLYW